MEFAHILPVIDARRCTGCGECARQCLTNAVALVGGRAAIVNPEACTFCDRCERSCPEEAIGRPFSIRFAATGRASDRPAVQGRRDR